MNTSILDIRQAVKNIQQSLIEIQYFERIIADRSVQEKYLASSTKQKQHSTIRGRCLLPILQTKTLRYLTRDI